MKHYVKQTMALLIVLAMTLVSLPIFADGEFTQESDFTALPAFVKENNGFIPGSESWQSSQCGYDSARTVFMCNANDAYMIFDAGKNNEYKTAEINVAYNNQYNHAWMFVQDDWRKCGWVQVSDDCKNWTDITDSTLGIETGTTGTFYKRTLNITLQTGYRYIRINTYLASYSSPHPIGAYSFYIHGAKLTGARAAVKPIIDDDLTTANVIDTVSGFDTTPWASTRCGYDSQRTIYYNSSTASAYMTFKAPDGKYFDGADFLITLHTDQRWLVNDAGNPLDAANLANRISYSDNGTDWTKAPEITWVRDEKVNYDGSIPHYNYTLSTTLENSC